MANAYRSIPRETRRLILKSAAYKADSKIDARKIEAEAQAQGSFQRALNRGWTREEALQCFNDAYEAHMCE